MRLSKKMNLFVIITLVGLFLDQITKWWVRNEESINPGNWKIIDGFFDIVHRENPGAAFGLLSGLPETWRLTIFLGFTVIAVIVILDMFRRLPKDDVFLSSTLALVLSGALGNAIDRIHQGTVTDFLRFYTSNPTLKDWLENHWPYMSEYPSFNVADAALVVGVGMFLVHYLFLEEKESKDEPEKSDDLPSPSEELDARLNTQETEEVEKKSEEG